MTESVYSVYSDLVLRDNGLCGLQRFLFTTALIVGIETNGDYSHRYCFEHEDEARAALQNWHDGEHPGGPWIKCKGLGVDILNPNLGDDDEPVRQRQRTS